MQAYPRGVPSHHRAVLGRRPVSAGWLHHADAYCAVSGRYCRSCLPGEDRRCRSADLPVLTPRSQSPPPAMWSWRTGPARWRVASGSTPAAPSPHQPRPSWSQPAQCRR